MSEIILPRRFKGQPQYKAPIDRQGLGKGVQVLFNPGAGSVDLATNRQWQAAGDAGVVVTTNGRAFNFDGNGDYYSYTGYPELSGSSGTFFMWLPRVGASDDFGHVYFVESTATVFFQVTNFGLVYVGGSLSTGDIAPWFNTRDRSLVLTTDGTAAGTKCYVDGFLASGLSWSSAPNAWPAGDKAMRLGNYSGGASWDTDASVLSAGYANRVWREAEVKAFHESKGNALFKALARRLRAIPASGITLVGATSTQANPSSTGAISQTHILTSANASQANSSGTGTVAQTHALSGANGIQANVSGTGAISGGITLVGATSTQASQSNTAGITQTHILVGANSTQVNPCSTGSIAGGANLTAASCVQANPSATGALAQTHVLTGANSAQGNPCGTGSITQTHALVMAASVQDNIAAASAIVQAHILAGANSTQGNLGGTGAISLSTGNLVGAPSLQVNLGGAGEIAQVGTVLDQWLSTQTVSDAIKKPGVPTGTPDWLKTILEIVLGRRGNRIMVPAEQTLTFSSTPTKAECEALYQYTNSVRTALDSLVNRLDS